MDAYTGKALFDGITEAWRSDDCREFAEGTEQYRQLDNVTRSLGLYAESMIAAPMLNKIFTDAAQCTRNVLGAIEELNQRPGAPAEGYLADYVDMEKNNLKEYGAVVRATPSMGGF